MYNIFISAMEYFFLQMINGAFFICKILNTNDSYWLISLVGPFLLAWMPEVMRMGKQSDFLKLLVNVIKFNAAYLDEEIVGKLVQYVAIFLENWYLYGDSVVSIYIM